ncbi:uncharacterized protein LOC122967156 [Scomber scombrus]|uniref:Uncharacterized protein LOC122967156 n=1 Tax=Scomber scombrus TaxID=13677 RepID=A0AAV1NYR5_SCOSC
MMKASSLSPGARTQHVFGLVAIIWFKSAVSAAGEALELQTIPGVVAQCGDNVTLTCDASSLLLSDIRSFNWVGRNKSLCKHDDEHDPEVLCESTAETTHHKLTLTLINVMPVHQGKYLCKLSSKIGVKYTSSFVKVQDCFGGSDSSRNESHAVCWFNGVYPSGTVHWFQGNANSTESASTQEVEDQHGQYNIISTINVKKNLPYNCSLWIPGASKYLVTLVIQPSAVKVKASGSTQIKLQWICMMMEIMMVKFIM